MTFAEAAARFASLSAQALGWRPHEFWAATPAELALSLGRADPGAAPPSRAELFALLAKETQERDA